MQDIEPDAIVNRGEPIPVISLPGAETQEESKSGFRKRLSDYAARSKEGGGGGLQERAFNALLSQMLPSEGELPASEKADKRAGSGSSKPQFSLPTMSTNFRRFNARIGVVFAFQNSAIQLFAWEEPTHTLSFLAVYTLVALNPRLLLVLPLAICVLFIMVPSYLARHPPPADHQPTEIFDITGPASAPPAKVKPAPELSHDFFRNMRDLQNSMADFTILHDALIAHIGPLTDFSNEKVSSALFLGLFGLSCLAFIGADLLPLRATALVLGWAAVGSNHPAVQKLLSSSLDEKKLDKHQAEAQTKVQKWIQEDFVLDDAPEVREVEVFELQHQSDEGEWESWLYSSSPYTPLSPARINGDRPVGTPFFEDVKPPEGWLWKSKKWDLDLLSRDWVEERMITAVEVETEGERWVYDMRASSVVEPGTSRRRDPKLPKQGWEERSGSDEKGAWRRRRWTRLVKRQVLKE